MASAVKGGARLRRTLRRLPDFVKADVVDQLRVAGSRLTAKAKAETPRRTGGLAGAIAFRVLEGSLKLRIGLLTKGQRRRFFYGFILDAGRKAKTVTIKSGKRRGARMRISPIGRNRYNFVFGRRSDFLRNELPGLRSALEKALSRASRGGGAL